jgi:eukaryotic-like serine/threonine-protein kinase
MEERVNTTISHYRIGAKLGAGGMGEVYLAEDTQLDRKVAIKFLPAESIADEQAKKRIVREAKAAAKLDHPNICSVHEVGEEDGHAFIVMQYVEGETLASRIQRKPLEVREVLDVGVQAADALADAHVHGIIHRDIKPQNIMITSREQVKVMDFGLAKLVEQQSLLESEAETQSLLTGPGIIVGTVPYMSPEQVRGETVDARSDIFSFGTVLYEMISGRQPFASESAAATASAILVREPPPLARYARELPLEFERIVSKALCKNRDERYQNTKDLLLDLKSLNQELEFQSKLERSAPPRREAATSTSQVADEALPVSPSRANTNGEFVRATSPGIVPVSSVEYIVSGIKQHKRGAALVLTVLLLAAGIGYWIFFHRSSNVTTIDSIAVMPFENVTHDQNIEYLSDGVTESLINSLSQLPHIKVIARNSVFSYKNQTPNLQQIAKQLNVQALLTGRVLMQGDTLDVRAELTDMQNNTQLWGDHYTRKAADIFTVQDEIARQVTDALRVRLTGGQQERITKRYTENAEAYRLYLQGRFYMNQVSEENFNRAVSFFGQAIVLDPRYALAYAARGESFLSMGDISLAMSEAKPKVERDIAAALSIDDKLVEARMLRANIEFHYDWNFAKAEEDFKQVIALDPNYAEAHHQYGAFYLPMMGRPMEGVAEMKLAQQLDPANPGINVDVCLPYYFARQYDQSIAQAHKAIEMFPSFFLPHVALGQALFQKGDYSTGIEEIEKAKAMEPTPIAIGLLGYVYARSGRKDEARKLLAELKEQSNARHVSPYWIAMIHAGLGEKDEAFAWLEKAYQERSSWLVWIKMDPMVDSLRSDSRFTDLMRRIGFPQ